MIFKALGFSWSWLLVYVSRALHYEHTSLMQSPYVDIGTTQIYQSTRFTKNRTHIEQVSNDISQLPRTHMLVVHKIRACWQTQVRTWIVLDADFEKGACHVFLSGSLHIFIVWECTGELFWQGLWDLHKFNGLHNNKFTTYIQKQICILIIYKLIDSPHMVTLITNLHVNNLT